MTMTERKGVSLVRLAALIGACACAAGNESKATVDSLPVAGNEQVAATVADSGCPKIGDWQLCSVEDRLTRAGLVIEKLDDVASRDFLSVQGTRFRLGAGEDEVEVFLYEGAQARIRDTEKLDSASVSPRGESRSYRVRPLLVTSGNLAALIFTMNERTSERVSLALSAGLPQR